MSVLDHESRWLAIWPQRDGRTLPRALRLRLSLAEGGTIERIFDVAAAE
jgi:general secretion pathway protein J